MSIDGIDDGSFFRRHRLRITMRVVDSRDEPVPLPVVSAVYGIESITVDESPTDLWRNDQRRRKGARHELNPDGRRISSVVGMYDIPEILLYEGPEAFEYWLFGLLMRFEEHEAREWFRHKGKIVDDPHDPTGKLA
jgi:hypothetical protein